LSGRYLFDALMRAAYRYRPPPQPSVPERLFRPAIERFAAFRKASLPVLLDGLIDTQGSPATWSLSRLRDRFADRVISVLPTQSGRVSSDVHTGVSFEAVRFGEYIDRLERGDHPEAYLITPGDTWLPELNEDLPPPEYCRQAAWRISRFWLSAPQTSSPLHHDVAENIFFQLAGRKRFYLYSPSASPWLYSNPFRSALPNYSRFDPEQPDYEHFPLSRDVRPLELILEPGTALYLPSRWWHQVRSLDLSVSFNFWFADGALSMAVRAAELVKRLRGLEIYGLEARLRTAEQLGAR
jgi:hypothetical protein